MSSQHISGLSIGHDNPLIGLERSVDDGEYHIQSLGLSVVEQFITFEEGIEFKFDIDGVVNGFTIGDITGNEDVIDGDNDGVINGLTIGAIIGNNTGDEDGIEGDNDDDIEGVNDGVINGLTIGAITVDEDGIDGDNDDDIEGDIFEYI